MLCNVLRVDNDDILTLELAERHCADEQDSIRANVQVLDKKEMHPKLRSSSVQAIDMSSESSVLFLDPF